MTTFQAFIILTSFGGLVLALAWVAIDWTVCKAIDIADWVRERTA